MSYICPKCRKSSCVDDIDRRGAQKWTGYTKFYNGDSLSSYQCPKCGYVNSKGLWKKYENPKNLLPDNLFII